MVKNLFKLLIGCICCSISSPLVAQNYQLTESQKAQVADAKRGTTKMALGLKQFMDDPSQHERFMMKKGKLKFIAMSNGDTQALKSQLEQIGAENCEIFADKVCGYIDVISLEGVELLSELKVIVPEYKPNLNVGVVDSEGDRSMLTDSVRNTLGLDGTGIKIGILSDSYNALGGADQSVYEGDLPGTDNPNGYTSPVVVLKDYFGSDASDEGRAMAEIIHDVAPGAELFFYTAFDGIFDFANGIRALETAGCDIIVDDVSYFAESYFQEAAVGGAVNEVAQKGVTYFSSAGNSARFSYEDEYRAANVPFTISGFGEDLHDFSGDGDFIQNLSVPNGATIQLWIMWDDPAPAFDDKPNPAPDTDLDAYLFGSTGLVDQSISNNPVSGFNIEVITYTNTTGADENVALFIEKFSGPDPRRVKYIDRAENLIFTELNPQGANAGTCVGHSNVAGAIAVGASAFFNTPAFNDFRADLGAGPLSIALLNTFSSAGGTPLLLDPNGNPINPLLTENPFIVGPDGTNTSFFGGDLSFAPDGFPNFFGTSASAPHVAAAAALLFEADNSLTTGDIRNALSETAEDMNDPFTPGFDTGYDIGTGHGFINAFDALTFVLGVEKLKLTSICNSSDGTHTWRVRNPNAFPVEVTYEVYKTNVAGSLLAQPGDNFFETEITGTTKIFWEDEVGNQKQTTKAPNNNTCTIETASIQVFPNPTSESLSIENVNKEVLSLSIVNHVGRKVFTSDVQAGERTTVDLLRFGKGTYHVIANYADGRVVTKSIVVR